MSLGPIDKVSAAFLTAKNENIFALANLNFDFSLVKLNAPPEYASVGTALTRRRQEDAESGPAHQTARKLGALFEATIPHTPLLIAAYGKRATQIVETPGANPPGSAQRHGPFAAYVGIDATSIWAAATSGSGSIAIHLLACLLARAFEDPAVATSIWVELVAERQRELRDGLSTSSSFGLLQLAAASAAGQRIPREELQQLDASTRAWLQTADGAMAKQHTQFQLIIKNLTMAVNSGAALSANVRGVWSTAMSGLERLLTGEALAVSNGAVLLAMSSWHLYPRLTVLSSPVKIVDVGDELMRFAGSTTVGMTRAYGADDQEGSAIYWSVSLSHFRYYGRPVDVVGTADDRLSISDLHLVAFGSLLRLWGIGRHEDPKPVARWVIALWDCVDRVKSRQARPQWLKLLASAASELLQAPEAHKRHCTQLIDFGHRRGDRLMGIKSGRAALPWFGLRSRHILGSLAKDSPAECAIQYLRELCSYAELEPDDSLITWISPRSKSSFTHLYASTIKRRHVELRALAAASTPDEPAEAQVPALQQDLPPEKGKFKDVEEEKLSKVITYHHTRWIGEGDLSGTRLLSLRPETRVYAYGGRSDFEVSHEGLMQQAIDSFESAVNLGFDDLEAGNPRATGKRRVDDYFDHHPASFPNLEHKTAGGKPLDGEKVRRLGCLLQAPGLVPERQKQWNTTGALLLPASGHIVNGLKGVGPPLAYDGILRSSQDFFRLWFVKMPAKKTERFEEKVRGLRAGEQDSLVSLDESTAQLSRKINPSLLWQFFEGSDPYDPSDFAKPVLELMEAERHANEELLGPLRNIAFATGVYTQLDGATISSRVVTTGFAEPKWGDVGTIPTRSQVFSCIAMMETGVVDLKPEGMEQVLGLSSGNSLFVLSQLLSDPGKQVSRSAVTRLAGNVGRPGVSLLVLPAASPLVRPLSSSYRAVQYAPFDGKWENNFHATSLHLSFTKHELPVDYGAQGVIDHRVFLVECVVSVHDGPEWVTDLDILSAFDNNLVPTVQRPSKRCQGGCEKERSLLIEEIRKNVTTVDSWEEVLDVPPGLTFVRAQGNWAARLAIASFLSAGHTGAASSSVEHGAEKVGAAGETSKQFAVLEAGGDDCYVCIYRRLRPYVKRRSAQQTLPFYVVI